MPKDTVAADKVMSGPYELLPPASEPSLRYVPDPRLPSSPIETDMQQSYTFGLIHGAWHRGEHWRLLENELRALGHDTVAPDLPAEDKDKDFDDDTAVVADALEGHDNIVLVAHSRGVEAVPRLLARQPPGRFIGAVILNSGGPYGFRLTPDAQDLPRHNPEYAAGVQLTDDGLTTYAPDYARRLFYSDAAEEVAATAVRGLRKQRQPDASPDGPIALPPEIPAYYILGTEDKVLNLERARRVAYQWLGKQAIELPTGHTPQISHPAQLAAKLLMLARLAKQERARRSADS